LATYTNRQADPVTAYDRREEAYLGYELPMEEVKAEDNATAAGLVPVADLAVRGGEVTRDLAHVPARVYHQRHLTAQAGQRALEEAQRLLGQARTRASEAARKFGSLIPADKWDKPINHFSSDLRRQLGKHTRATELERELRSLGQAVTNPMLDLRAPARPNALAVREQVHHLVRLFAPATPALEGYRRSLRDGATLPPILLENLHYDASNLTMYLMDPIQLFTRIPEWERELEQAMRDWEGLTESASYSAARPGAGARETRDLAEELRTPVGNRIRKLACALTEAQAALAFP